MTTPRPLLDQARAIAGDYLDEVGTRCVYPDAAALAGLAAFRTPLPPSPADGATILRLLAEHGSPATVAQMGGRYFGFVCGGSLPAAVAARWIGDVWDQNAAMAVLSPVAAELEATCERWLVELLGLPASTVAGFVGGTSTATLCGIAAGRNALLERLGWDVNADGLFGAPPLRVIVGAQAHASVAKVLSLLGLGRARVETVPCDAQGRMRADRLPALDRHCLVIAQAGNVNSGAFDPFEPICAAARAAGAWVHVDGAFGLWAAASASTRALTHGVDGADSWSADAHKTLNAPYDCGIVFCRDRAALVGAMQANASYLVLGGAQQRDGMLYTPEMSRRARSVELWATLMALGRSGVDELVAQLCAHARAFAARLREAGFRVLNDVVFNQALVGCASPALTQATLAEIQRGGECWCGGAVWNDEPVIRISVCSWVTTAADIERSAAAFVDARERATRGVGDPR